MHNANQNTLAEVRSAISARYPGISCIKVKFGQYNRINVSGRVRLPDGHRARIRAWGWRPDSALGHLTRKVEAWPDFLSGASSTIC